MSIHAIVPRGFIIAPNQHDARELAVIIGIFRRAMPPREVGPSENCRGVDGRATRCDDPTPPRITPAYFSFDESPRTFLFWSHGAP
jgi:hypothetical protein